MLSSLRKRIALMIAPELVHEMDLLRHEADTAKTNIDTKKVMRHLLHSMDIDMNVPDTPFRGLTVEQQKNFAAWGASVHESEWWKYMYAWLRNTQAATTLNELMSGRTDTQIFGAGTLNGFLLVDEGISKLNNVYVGLRKPEEPFDAHKLIQP